MINLSTKMSPDQLVNRVYPAFRVANKFPEKVASLWVINNKIVPMLELSDQVLAQSNVPDLRQVIRISIIDPGLRGND